MKIRTAFMSVIVIATAILFATSITVQASRADGRIKSSAKKSYVFKTYLKGDHIKVQSKDGVVVLSGTVSEESHRSMAEETMLGIPEVKSVDNQLTITASPATANSDAWIAERVRNTLLVHRRVSYANTNVSVANGKVTLRGEASSEAQKQLTTEYARDVFGVKEVDNQTTITAYPAKAYRTKDQKVDDASITTQALMSMRYHHGADVFATKISTHKGVVTLSGTAANQAEIDLATKRVRDIHGVKSVKNLMTISNTQSSTN